jgi:hypothetical protein
MTRKKNRRTDVVSYRYLPKEPQVGVVDPGTIYPERSIGLAHKDVLMDVLDAVNSWRLEEIFTPEEKTLIFQVGRYIDNFSEFRSNGILAIADKAGDEGEVLTEKIESLSPLELWALWSKCRNLDYCLMYNKTPLENSPDLAGKFLA